MPEQIEISENKNNAAVRFGSIESGFGAEGSGEAFEAWKKQSDYILNWFYDPDLDALRMIYSIICAHFVLKDKPSWYFLLGDSGSGKTVLGIDPCVNVARATILSQITKNAFISGFKGDGQANKGLLQQGDRSKSMIWLFKDFTSITAMTQNDFKDIAGQLREVADGSTSKSTGSIGNISWKGRVTTIAAATPSIERHWAAQKAFGERFSTIRWRTPSDRDRAITWAMEQQSYRTQVDDQLKHNVTQILNPKTLSEKTKLSPDEIPKASSSMITKLVALTDWAGWLQTQPERDFQNRMRFLPSPEFPTRLISSAQFLMQGHAILMNRPEVSKPELRLAEKLILDSIPIHRRQILESFPPDPLAKITKRELASKTNIPIAALYDELECLKQLGILNINDDLDPKVSWGFQGLRLAAKAGLMPANGNGHK